VGVGLDEDANDDTEDGQDDRQHDLPELQRSRGRPHPAAGSPGAVERASLRALLAARLARAGAGGRPGEAEHLVS